MILDICSQPEVLNVFRIINIAIKLIQYSVPIILIVTITLDCVKSIVSGDASSKDILKNSSKKIIAGMLIFFVPLLVTLITNLTTDTIKFSNCFANANNAGIQKAHSNIMSDLMTNVETKYSKDPISSVDDYNSAIKYINNIKNKDERKKYQDRLEEIRNGINLAYQKKNEENNKPSKPSGTNPVNPGTKVTYSKTILMGDSRTNGLKNVITNNETIVAKDGGNYYDFLNHAQTVKGILSQSNDGYNIVLNYGVNDLRKSSDYCAAFNDFASSIDKKHKIFIVSVNPLRDSKKNVRIEAFNNNIKSCVTSAYYCDIYYSIPMSTWDSYIRSDGIHYTTDGSRFIYNKINNCLRK